MHDDADVLRRLLYRFVEPANIIRLQRRYAEWFRAAGARTVLDVGCGRGLFLDLLRQAGIGASGIDGNPDAVAECTSREHLDVECVDALEGLERLVADGRRFDGVFCSHVIEHMPGPDAVRLVSLCARVLTPGGRLLLITPNPANLKVWTNVFWLDPTHVRPYPRRMLAALMEEVGLRVVRSFADPHTRSGIRDLIPDFLRYGPSVLSGLDSVMLAELATDSASTAVPVQT